MFVLLYYPTLTEVCDYELNTNYYKGMTVLYVLVHVYLTHQFGYIISYKRGVRVKDPDFFAKISRRSQKK